MKVIELLAKIANGEETHFDTKLNDKSVSVRYYNDRNFSSSTDPEMLTIADIIKSLNDEVEIIEEKEETKPITKEIEALGYACGEIQKCFTNGWKKSLKNESLIEEDKKIEKLNKMNFHKKQRQLANKINEIIDYINGSDKE